MNELKQQMQLTPVEALKFKFILRSIPPQINRLNVVITEDEKRSILATEAKLKEMENALSMINDAKQSMFHIKYSLHIVPSHILKTDIYIVLLPRCPERGGKM